jgi:ribosomal protein S4|tara:strand:+ start:2092 stop:2823 length:732 start_codon:yes stop_codon:yes gene_type:complete
MIKTKKYRHKPVYKKFAFLKKNVQNKSKLLNFKKRKWQFLLSQLAKISKTRKNNSYYKFYDQNVYLTPKYNNFFSKNYKQNLLTKKAFNLFYGNLLNRFLKKSVFQAQISSNRVQNKINSKLFFKELLERRLDTTLLRSHFVTSTMNARQLISHGHVRINSVRVYDSSVLLKKGDVITFSKKSHKLLKHFLLSAEFWPLPPQTLQISYKIFQIVMVDDVKLSNSSDFFSMWLNFNEVIECYKR